jgi:hypothetical protein
LPKANEATLLHRRWIAFQRPAAWRCGGNLVQKFNRSTIAQPCTSA